MRGNYPVVVRMPPDLIEKIDEAVGAEETRSSVIRRILRDQLDPPDTTDKKEERS